MKKLIQNVQRLLHTYRAPLFWGLLLAAVAATVRATEKWRAGP